MFSISLSSNSTYSVEWDLSPLPKSRRNPMIALSIKIYYFLGPRSELNASISSMTARTIRMTMNPMVIGLAEPAMFIKYQIIAANTVIQRKKIGDEREPALLASAQDVIGEDARGDEGNGSEHLVRRTKRQPEWPRILLPLSPCTRQGHRR